MTNALNGTAVNKVASAYEYQLYGREMCVKIYSDDPLEDETVAKCWENVYRCVEQWQAKAEKFNLPSYGDAPPRSYPDFSSCVFAARRAARMFVLQKRDAEEAKTEEVKSAQSGEDLPARPAKRRPPAVPPARSPASPHVAGATDISQLPEAGPQCTAEGTCQDVMSPGEKKKTREAGKRLSKKAAEPAVVAVPATRPSTATTGPASPIPAALTVQPPIELRTRTKIAPSPAEDGSFPPDSGVADRPRRRPVTSIFDSDDGIGGRP